MTNQHQRICPNLDNNELRHSKSNRKPVSVFATKEEYIADLAEKHKIELDTHHPNDGYLYVKGVLVIDESCNPYWDWSDVVATSAVVKKDKDNKSDMVKRYHHLPKTYKGIKTDLKPMTIESYMLHNNYGAKADKDGIYNIKTLRIPPHTEHLDYSCIKAEITLFFSDNSIALSKLPYSQNLFGISIGRLDIDCDNPYEVAKEKGCGYKILKALEPKKKNIFTGFAGYIGSIVGFGDARR